MLREERRELLSDELGAIAYQCVDIQGAYAPVRIIHRLKKYFEKEMEGQRQLLK